MKFFTAKLADVAPPRGLKKKVTDDSELVWHLNLDQVEPQTGRILDEIIAPVSEAGNSTQWFDERHVLYSKLRPYLNKVVVPEKQGIATTELVPMVPDPDRLDRKYLAYYLRSDKFVSWVSAQVAGAKMPRVSMNVLWEHEIPIPSLAEQQRIVAILDKADDLRYRRQQTIDLADQLLRSVFLKLLGDLVSNPKGWDTFRLGELITSGPFNGLYKHSSEYGEGTRILRIDGFYNGVLEDQNELKRVRLSSGEVEKYALCDKSIVINRVNSREYLGKCALIEGLNEPTVFESNMMNFKVDERLAIPSFVVDQLCTPYVKGQILTSCKDAVNQSSINQQDVKSIELRIPPMAVQNKYFEIASKIRSSTNTARNQLVEFQYLFAALNQQAFAGQL